MKRRRLFGLLVLSSLLTGLFVPNRSVQARGRGFADVVDSPYRTAIETLHDLGLITGRAPDAYEPAELVTRAEMAVLLLRAARQQITVEDGDQALPFSDLPSGYWAASAIRRASELEWIRGADGRFRPTDPVTHEEAITMILRAAGQAKDITGRWPDGYVAKAWRLGLTDGIEFTLGARLTRGEAAQLLYEWIMRVPTGDTGLTLNQSSYKVLAALAIVPDTLYLTTDHVPIASVVTDPGGRTLDLTARLTAEGGELDGDTLIVHSGTHTVTVTAELGGLSSTRTYRFLSGLRVIAPAEATWPGSEVALRAALEDGSSAPDLSWTASRGASISPEGIFSAARSGVYTVTAQSQGLSAEARILVASDLLVEPTEAVAAPGAPLKFTLRGRVGQESAPVSSAIWQVDGVEATVDATGTFTATTAGRGTVTAKVADRTASAHVTVTGAPGRLSASLSQSRVGLDGESPVVVTIKLLDDGDALVPIDGQMISVQAEGVPAELEATSLQTVRGVAQVTVRPGTTEGMLVLRFNSGALPPEIANVTVGGPIPTVMRLQVYPSFTTSIIYSSRPLLLALGLFDGSGEPAPARERMRFRLISQPFPVPSPGWWEDMGFIVIDQGMVGVVMPFLPRSGASVVEGTTLWAVREQDGAFEPVTDRVKITVAVSTGEAASLKVFPAFQKVPADGVFSAPAIFMGLDRNGVEAPVGLDNAVFTVKGPGGSQEVRVSSSGMTQFYLPPQTKPGIYTVTESTGTLKSFKIEYYDPDA